MTTVREPGDMSAVLQEHWYCAGKHRLASQAGRLLEAICDRLSWTLPVAVQRRREDRYDIGSLWPPLMKKLRRSNVAEVLESVDSSLLLRNLLGAHFNEMAEAVPDSDADEFGEAVLRLWDSVFCVDCGQWVVTLADGRLTCRCGATSITM